MDEHECVVNNEDCNMDNEIPCVDCIMVHCPFEEPLHFHHDGCPACDA